MKTVKSISTTALFGAMLLANFEGALAQTNSPHQMMHENRAGSLPAQPGQDAFGAIQEIITILEADPSTDWSQVDISKLRSHLVDMNLLIMGTVVTEKEIDGGLEMVVTGQKSALEALQTMVPAHASMINGLNRWNVKTEVKKDSVKLTVTTPDQKETSHIRGLGFYGLMVSGSHHQAHHLGLARGENVHTP